MDLITRIKAVPHSAHQFITLARKDNFAYLWDRRDMSTFLQLYEQPLYGNQRTGLELSLDGRRVYFGGEDGSITAKDVASSAPIFQLQTASKQCVSSLCHSNSHLLAAVGSRSFPLACEPSPSANGLVCCVGAAE